MPCLKFSQPAFFLVHGVLGNKQQSRISVVIIKIIPASQLLLLMLLSRLKMLSQLCKFQFQFPPCLGFEPCERTVSQLWRNLICQLGRDLCRISTTRTSTVYVRRCPRRTRESIGEGSRLPVEFLFESNKCYGLETDRLEWEVARMRCNSLHPRSHPVIVDDHNENQIITALVKSIWVSESYTST